MVPPPLKVAVGPVIRIGNDVEVVPQAAVTVTPRVTLPEQPAVKVTAVPFVAEASVPPEIVQAYVAPVTAGVEALPAAEALIGFAPLVCVITTGLHTGWDHPE